MGQKRKTFGEKNIRDFRLKPVFEYKITFLTICISKERKIYHLSTFNIIYIFFKIKYKVSEECFV